MRGPGRVNTNAFVFRVALASVFGVFSLACSDPQTASPPLPSCNAWSGELAAPLFASNVDGCTPPEFFGHRGSWKSWAPENTMPAFRCAVDQGAHGIEIDVQMTLDQVIIALHDSTPNRTTNASSLPVVSELNFAELEALDAGAWFDPTFAGTRIPRLADVLDEIEPSGVQLLFDVKRSDIVAPLVVEIESRGLGQRSIISSSSLATLEAADAADTHKVIRLLYYIIDLDELPTLAANAPARLQYIRVPKSDVDAPDAVERIDAAGFEAVTGEYRVDYRYAFALVDDMDAVWARVRDKTPAHCD